MNISLSRGPAVGAKTLHFGHVGAQPHAISSAVSQNSADTLQLGTAVQPHFGRSKAPRLATLGALAALVPATLGLTGCGGTSEAASNTGATSDTVTTAPAKPSVSPTTKAEPTVEDFYKELKSNGLTVKVLKNPTSSQLDSIYKAFAHALAGENGKKVQSFLDDRRNIITFTESADTPEGVTILRLGKLPPYALDFEPDKLSKIPPEVMGKNIGDTIAAFTIY